MTVMGGTCEGTPCVRASYAGNFATCVVSGCTLVGGGATCTGTPTPCAGMNIHACGTVVGPDGCAPSSACSGTAASCSTDASTNQCNLQVGCAWM